MALVCVRCGAHPAEPIVARDPRSSGPSSARRISRPWTSTDAAQFAARRSALVVASVAGLAFNRAGAHSRWDAASAAKRRQRLAGSSPGSRSDECGRIRLRAGSAQQRDSAHATPELTWEWLIADDNKPYASLFSAETRRRVRAALEADAGYSVWKQREEQAVEAQRQQDDRIRKIREDIRAGKRERLSLPELDQGL